MKREGVTLGNSGLFYLNKWGGMMRLKPTALCYKRRRLFAMNKERLRIMTGLDKDYVKGWWVPFCGVGVG